MDVPGVVPDSIECHGCKSPLDLAGQQPFTEVECAQCGAVSIVPSQFGNLLLLSVLGVGGMGTVYKAIDTQLNRYVAVKIIRKKFASDPQFIETFAREARSAAAVNHPHVAQVYSFAEHAGQYYLTMELLERGSLDERITHQHKLPEADVLKIGVAIADGLRAAHQSNLLHRDIKPGNILFNDEGQPKLVDFGLALAQHETAVGDSGVIWGTPYYIAPEKLRGQPEDFRSDLYSLGATLFHALAGRPPFDAKTTSEVVAKHTSTPALNLKTFNPAVQGFTAQVIGRTLAKDPADRYKSYDALIHDLEEAERRLRAQTDEPVVVTSTGERVTVKSALITYGIVIASLVVLVLLWFNRQKLGFESSTTLPLPPPPVLAGSSNSPAAPGETPVTEEVDFTENAPWAKSWNTILKELSKGQYQAALGECANMEELTRDQPRHRQWAYFMEGVTLVAAGRGAEAGASFDRAGARAKWPDKITPTNLVEPLAAFMKGDLPAAAPGQLPVWAAAFEQFLTGLQQFTVGKLAEAQATFQEFEKVPVDSTQPWVFILQGLAKQLIKDVENIPVLLAEIDKLQADGKIDAALKLTRLTRNRTPIASFQKQLDDRETALLQVEQDAKQKIVAAKQAEQAQKEVERVQQQAAEDLAKQQAAAEVQRVQAVAPTIAGTMATYDFKAAAGKYDALASQLTTADGQQALARRQAAMRWLQEFKVQLAADFRAKPYDASRLVTRSGVNVAGKLASATDTQLVFELPYGEMQAQWRDLTPQTLQVLGEFYAQAFTPTEKPALLARRYVAVAVFAKEFNLNNAADLAQAVKLDPAIQTDIDAVFGK